MLLTICLKDVQSVVIFRFSLKRLQKVVLKGAMQVAHERFLTNFGKVESLTIVLGLDFLICTPIYGLYM